jgi:hypothetical protein
MKFVDGQETNITRVDPIGIISIKNGKIVSNDIPNVDNSYMAAKVDIEFDPKNGAIDFMVAFNDEEYFIVQPIQNNAPIMRYLDLEFTNKDKEILESALFHRLTK